MKLIVGLGNPGRRYVSTRHNIGFEILGAISRKLGGDKPKAKFEGEIIETRWRDSRICLLCPLTYMNLSGRSVKAAADFYQIAAQDILIICDDFNLDLGRLRFRKGGSSGGQNGLGDIIEKFGTREIPRLRVGVGKPPARWNPADFVLSKFAQNESVEVEIVTQEAADAALGWFEFGIDKAMNRYNIDPKKLDQKTGESKQTKKRPNNKRPNNKRPDDKRPDNKQANNRKTEDRDSGQPTAGETESD